MKIAYANAWKNAWALSAMLGEPNMASIAAGAEISGVFEGPGAARPATDSCEGVRIRSSSAWFTAG